MNNTAIVIVLLIGLVVLAVMGYFVFVGTAPEPGPTPIAAPPPVTRSPSPGAGAPEGPDTQRVREDLASLRKELRGSEQALDAARREIAARDARITELEEELAPYRAIETLSLQEVMTLMNELKGQGLAAYLQPGKTNRLAAHIRALGDEGLQAVLGMLESPDENERFLAAKLLEDLADPAAIADLTRAALGDENELVANQSSHALALMGDERARASLRKLVDETERDGVRINSLFGLVSLGEHQSIEQTIAFLRDENTPDGYQHALGGGVLILDKPHVMPIVAAIAEMRKSSADYGEAVINYYKRVGNVDARAALQRMIDDPGFPESVRELARRALW